MLSERQARIAQALRDNPKLFRTFLPRLNKYIPHKPTPKQAAFLATRNITEVFYGGAAAGGKSDALLMAALEYVDDPNYAALILRRTFAQLDMPDSILDRAKKWLAPFKEVKWVQKKSRFEFPSGAVIQFGYLQFDADVYQYDGPSYQFIGFDELTQFTEFQFKFMAGRLRRLQGSQIPLRLRGASNPGNVGHFWVKQRFIKYRGKDRLFIPARLEDNPHADRAAYETTLNKMDPVSRAQRRFGDWEVTQEGTVFRREWFNHFQDEFNASDYRRVRYWDLAATLNAGDWLVGTKLGTEDKGKWYVEHVVRSQPGPAKIFDVIHATAQADGVYVPIRIEQEGGASGKTLIASLIRDLAGWDVKGEPSMKAKITRWQPFATQAEHGNVVICAGDWNEEWLDEMCAVPSSKHDDQADSVSGAFKYLAVDASTEFGIDVVSIS